MPATLIGAIYSAAQARVRRIVIPDDDKQLDDPAWLLPGETMLTYDAKLGADEASAQAQINQATGRKPDNDSCAVVDVTGTVIAVIKADPSIDVHPDGALVKAYADVGVGCTYDDKTDEFISPSFVLQAGVDKLTGELIPEKTVPARVIEKPTVQ